MRDEREIEKSLLESEIDGLIQLYGFINNPDLLSEYIESKKSELMVVLKDIERYPPIES